jgi:hypothetical protein
MACNPKHCGGCDDLPYKCFDSLNLKKGDRITFVHGHSRFTEIIESIDRDDETGEVSLGMQ